MAETTGPRDRIHIEELRVRCIVGIRDEERVKKQDVIIHITLQADLRKPGRSDDIAETVDYATLKQQVVEMVEASQFYLIEKLAQEVADLCLAASRVHAATVTVEKPGALRFAKSVAVEITRTREDA
ncbi:MAG: dihydroneopterin aldolase [Planctomycetes bacterium]|jgi:FolB domain-containing protein|nr:dihydroneopterin aldolase [Planctomycetota bacterium]